jgi:Bacterial regulatory proteins, luxR family
MVAWVATGLANEEIARELFLSPATVRTHVSRAMVKLRARDRAQLVVFAIQSGLTVPGPPSPPGAAVSATLQARPGAGVDQPADDPASHREKGDQSGAGKQ